MEKDKIVIGKIINNNIISSTDEYGGEMVIMGCGIGYGKKAGHIIEEEKIEKIFKLDNKDNLERFKELLGALPLEYIQVSDEIISYARETLGVKLNQNVYLTLTDHIGFAIDRHKEGMIFNNALQEEVRLFYPTEYAVGRHALDLIETKTGIRLCEDEAASIALHLLSAEFNVSINNTFIMIKMVREMMEIIEKMVDLEAGSSYPRNRLIMNLKQLATRLLSEIPVKGFEDPVFYDFVKNHCAEEYKLIDKVDLYIGEQYGCNMTNEEHIYMSLDVKRIRDIYKKYK